MGSDFNILETKLRNFRRKYLSIELIRGTIIVALLFLIIFLILNFLEYSIYMPSAWRRIIFLTTLLFLGLAALRYVLYPALQLTGIIQLLDDKKVSRIIKKGLPDVKDKIINAIELQGMNEKQYSVEITAAAISQKVRELSIFNFNDALSLKHLKTLALYLAASFILVVSVYLIDKSLIVEPGNRIIHYNQEFVKPAPFRYMITSDTLQVRKGKDFKLEVSCEGKELPSILYINIGGNNFLMKPAGAGSFEFGFTSVLSNIDFYLTDLKYNSGNYTLEVLPVPVVNEFTIQVDPPGYTGLERTVLENVGDLRIPAGSRITWIFNCYDTDSLKIVFRDGPTLVAENTGKGNFRTDGHFHARQVYGVAVKNRKTAFETIMNFTIDVIDDFFPEIKVVQIQDSVKLTRFYFKGNIADDYGFTQLAFHLNNDQQDSVFSIPVVPYLTDQEFYYSIDFQEYNLEGKTVSYYFTVTDNDRINNPKTSASESYLITFPGRREVNELLGEKFENIESKINETQELARELQSDIKELQIKNLNNNLTDWDRSQMINDIVEKKSDLEQMLDQIERMNDNYNNYQNTFQNENPELKEKQEMVENLLEDVMTDELKKLLEEFAQMLEKFDSSKFNDLNKKMSLSMEDLSKQLDRNIEMLRKMKVEKDFREVIERIDSLQRKQEGNASAILENRDFEQQRMELEKDKGEISDIREEIARIMGENEKLKNPAVLDDFDPEFGEIMKNMGQTGEEMDKKNARDASKSMKETSQKLKELSFAMQRMLDSNAMQENAENIENIKQILRNLLYLSFEQESILVDVSSVSPMDPSLRGLTREQRKLEEQSKVVKDSLYALSLRAPQVGNVVNNELMTLELSMARAGELMSEALYSQSGTHQQLAVTSVNNLALMLSEVLRNIEEQMANQTPGNENCQSGKQGNMGMLKSQSENLRNQLQRMIDEMKSGKSMSREMSQSLMEHEMMQKMLRELMNNGSVGSEARKQLQQIDQLLERNRKELMNKNINRQLIQRQQEILTRLLEAEKSERERDLDNKRESNTADEEFYNNPARMFENPAEKKVTMENIQKGNLKLSNFYQKKYRNYVEKITGEAMD